MLPFPGTPDASPTGPISFPTLRPPEVVAVTVVGARSGRHGGRLMALGGQGAAFQPARAFRAGERVSVHARLAEAVGPRAARRVDFQFTVAVPVSSSQIAAQQSSKSSGPTQATVVQNFRSRPDLQPPRVTVTRRGPATDQGYIFVAPTASPQDGPMIVNDRGQTIWFDSLPDGDWGFDFRAQQYQGRPVLTWFQGHVSSATGAGIGEDVIADSSYRIRAVVRVGSGYQTDLHEFKITPQGTALLAGYETVMANLSSVRGPKKGMIEDSIVEEVDIATGQVLWDWHALGHIPLSDSFTGQPQPGVPWDFFHLNSIDVDADGNVIISARNTWAVYKINRLTGAIMWQLGGKRSSFRMGPGTRFAWQHDARRQRDGTLNLFDNEATPTIGPQSRVITLALQTGTMTARLIRSITHHPALLAVSQGNAQTLPGGNVFVGWGSLPNFSEFRPDGRDVFDGSFTAPAQSYRAYRLPWAGHPIGVPAVAVSHDRGGPSGTVYISWNGATQVARWRVLAGPAAARLVAVATAPWNGFETAVHVRAAGPRLEVQALSRAGAVLASTAVLTR